MMDWIETAAFCKFAKLNECFLFGCVFLFFFSCSATFGSENQGRFWFQLLSSV